MKYNIHYFTNELRQTALDLIIHIIGHWIQLDTFNLFTYLN